MKKIILFLIIMILSLQTLNFSEAKTLKIDADSPSIIFVKQNQDMLLQFGGNPTTGYRWKVELIPQDTSVLKLTDGIYVPQKNRKKKVGYGGTYKFTIKAVNKGEAQIKCIYSRSWEKKPFSVVVYDVYVE